MVYKKTLPLCFLSYIVCSTSNFLAQATSDDLYLIDTIEAVVHSDERTDIITYSDVQRPALDGARRSLDDLIFEKLIYQDAAKYKMLPSEDAIDTNLQVVQRENNLSHDDMLSIFKTAGYSLQEGREQFGIMAAINTMLDFRIRSRLIVPERDIRAYYRDHPVMREASYLLSRADIYRPEHFSETLFKQALDELIKTGSGNLSVTWSEPFWVNTKDLAEALHTAITSIGENKVARIGEAHDPVELVKIVDQKPAEPIPFEECYMGIAETLKRPKFTEMFEQYKKNLYDEAGIIRFNQSTVTTDDHEQVTAIQRPVRPEDLP